MATKSKRDRKANRKYIKKCKKKEGDLIAQNAFQKRKKYSNNFSKNLELAKKGELETSAYLLDIKFGLLLYSIIQDRNFIMNEKKYFQFFNDLSKKKCDKLFEDREYVKKLLNVARLNDLFIRDIKTWKRSSRNIHKQFSDIVRHLFCKYDVPKFMDEAWKCEKIDSTLKEIPIKIQWFLDIGNGKNIRKSEGLPVVFTKKMAHLFLNAPPKYTINEAIRYAQIKAIGGDDRLVNAINETHMSRNFDNDSFWVSVIEFFVKNPMIDPSRIWPIIDYIKHQKFEPTRDFIDGVWVELNPENPDFSMKGRNPNRILQQTEEWHNRLNKEPKKKEYYSWKGLPILNYNDNKKYEIVQLLNVNSLSKEGSAMNHCVSSYVRSCNTGRCGIFSLRQIVDKVNIKRLVTIEVLKNGKIVQVRGKNNRTAELSEKNVIKKWAIKEGLIY